MPLNYISPDDLPRVSGVELALEGDTGIWIEPPAAERRLLRYAPEFFDDPSNASTVPSIGAAVYRSPPVFVVRARHAELVGYRTIISGERFHDDEIISGGSAGRLAHLEKISQPDPFLNERTALRSSELGSFELERVGRSVRHVTDPAVVLCSHEPSNYGSFLFRVLPKLVVLQTLGLMDRPMVVWAFPESFQRLLALLGIAPGQVVQHDVDAITKLSCAWFPSLRNPNAFLDRASWALLQGLADRFVPTPRGRRIYVSRMRHGKVSGSTRVLLNEAELVDRLGALGFDIIEPEQLSIDEQITAFASADMVVGPAGSGMFNAVFCRPGTKIVDIESEPNWLYAHAGLFASCQLRYGIFVGRIDPDDPRPVHRRWSVDVNALVDRIERFMRAE